MAHIDPHQPPLIPIKSSNMGKITAPEVSNVTDLALKALALIPFPNTSNETKLLKPTLPRESITNTDTKIRSLAPSILSPRNLTNLRNQALQITKKSRLKDLHAIDCKDFENLSNERRSMMVEELIRNPALQPVIIRLIPQLKSKEILESVLRIISQVDKNLSLSVYLNLSDNWQKKIMVETIDKNDLPVFFEKILETDDPFSLALFAKKINDPKTLSTICLFSEKILPSQKVFFLFLENWDNPKLLNFPRKDLFQTLCLNFIESGFGTKEEFLTGALNKFFSIFLNKEGLRTLEPLENAALDIGRAHDPSLIEGNNNNFDLFIFSIATLFPTIQKKFQNIAEHPIQITAKEFSEELEKLDPSTRNLVEKIFTIFFPPKEAVKRLAPIQRGDLQNLPSIKPKHEQYSGSCVVKAFNSLLSMSFDAPSVIIKGGWPQHAVYLEVFKGEQDQYFCLLHNLGAESEKHSNSREGKVFPLALFFPSSSKLNSFLQRFDAQNKEGYSDLIDSQTKLADLKEEDLKSEINREITKALTRVIPRENPLYKKFRSLQKESLRQMLASFGSIGEEKKGALEARTKEKSSFREEFLRLSQEIRAPDP